MTLTADTAPPMTPRRLPAWAGYASALALVAAATVAAILVQRLTSIPNLSLVFVLPVVIAAASFGWGPSLAAALAGALAYNFFLIAPLYTLRVADSANAWAVILLLATAALVSAVAAQARTKALEARLAAAQALALQALARQLVGALDRPAIAQVCAEALARLFQAPAVVLVGEQAEPLGLAGGAILSPPDQEAASWALASRLATRGGAYPVDKARFDFWPVVTPQRGQAVVGVAISGREQGRPEAPERLVEIVCAYLSVALDRDHYAGQALAAAGERLKTDLLAAVSHDLKTPLSTILISLQSLQKFEHAPEVRADLLAGAEREAARLAGLVDNLLSMNRLEAGAVVVHAEPAALTELLEQAQAHAAPALEGRRIATDLPQTGLWLQVDRTLFTVALGNLLENAGRYSPPGSVIEVRAGDADGAAWIEVRDQGPGFPTPIAPLFERFERGVAGDGRLPGTGLGLAIARGFLEAQGGGVEAWNLERGGACVRLHAPLAAA